MSEAEVRDATASGVGVVAAVELVVLVHEVLAEKVHKVVEGLGVGVVVGLEVDLDAVDDVVGAVQLGGVVGELLHGDVGEVAEIGVEVPELAVVVVVVGLDLLPAIHARVEERGDGLDALDFRVGLGSLQVVGVKVDADVAHSGVGAGVGVASAAVGVALAGPELDVTAVRQDGGEVVGGGLGGRVELLDVGSEASAVARGHHSADVVRLAEEGAVGVRGMTPLVSRVVGSRSGANSHGRDGNGAHGSSEGKKRKNENEQRDT
mmetsp:Transcript_48899/g.72656  ORF Transcript_48899/g.72656 Transcript_48899/m.72656 type:complete len:263 (+) Transcript_48899:911-1699(+)